MGVKINKRNREGGFAGLEAVLILVIVAAVVGVGAYVVHQKHMAESTLSSTNSSPQATAPLGTASSVDQLTQQDAKTEASLNNNADTSLQQDATSTNTTIGNVGGAYNEANY